MYNDQLVYEVVIWAFLGISLWTEKIALICVHAFREHKNDCYDKSSYIRFVYSQYYVY